MQDPNRASEVLTDEFFAGRFSVSAPGNAGAYWTPTRQRSGVLYKKGAVDFVKPLNT